MVIQPDLCAIGTRSVRGTMLAGVARYEHAPVLVWELAYTPMLSRLSQANIELLRTLSDDCRRLGEYRSSRRHLLLTDDCRRETAVLHPLAEIPTEIPRTEILSRRNAWLPAQTEAGRIYTYQSHCEAVSNMPCRRWPVTVCEAEAGGGLSASHRTLGVGPRATLRQRVIYTGF